MIPISRGFGGRRRDRVDPSRIPPDQYRDHGFPVLSAGPTRRTPLEEWTFSIQGAVHEERSWTWDEFTALPAEDVTVDIRCVTKWSRLDTRWNGVSVDCAAYTARRPKTTALTTDSDARDWRRAAGGEPNEW